MKKLFFIITSLLACSISFAQVNGKINPSAGQKLIVETKLNTQTSSEMMGQTIESNGDMSSTYKVEVKEIKGNNINLTNTFTGLKFHMKVMENDISFDSDKKEDMDGDIGKNFKDILNQPKEVVMDKSGNIIVSEKNDSAAEKSSNNPAMLAMGQMIGDPAEQGYGAKLAFEVIPANAKIGSSWTDSSSNAGSTKVTHYTLKERNGNEGKIVITGTLNSDVKAEMQGMEIQTKTTGSFTGEEIVDLKTGVIKQNSTAFDTKGIVSVMGQEIPTSAKINSVTTVHPL